MNNSASPWDFRFWQEVIEMSDELYGLFENEGLTSQVLPEQIGQVTEALARFLQSDPGGSMNLRDCGNLLDVAMRFRSTVQIEDGKIIESRTPALVGKVQSGKTTGMALMIAALADAGVSCFLVLTGTKTTLTEQTADELKEKFESRERDRPWRWRFVSADAPSEQIENAVTQVVNPRNTIDQTRDLLLITCMKEDDYLEKINGVLTLIGSRDVDLSKRFIVFDDEGDQASTDNSPRNRNETSTINGLLTDLRSLLGIHVFVPVTATPQALLVQESSNAVRPDTAILLPPGSEYVGGEVLFGDLRAHYVREIPEADVAALATEQLLPPESLQKALATFLLTAAVVRRGSRRPLPISMLIHPHQQRRPHTHTIDWVNRLLDGWLVAVETSDHLSDEACYQVFLEAARDLESTSSERIQLSGFGTSVDKLSEWIRAACSIIQRPDLQVRKISGRDRFNRDEWGDSDAWIFVGGEVLGRGFVVKGLVTTYMPRDVAPNRQYNVDTLQQRARFFGYKRSYLDLLRGWFPSQLSMKFEQYVEHEEFLWSFLKDQSANGRDLRHSRSVFELSEHARPTRASTNRTRGRSNPISPLWIQQSYLYEERLSTNLATFLSWKTRDDVHLEAWSPPRFTTQGISYDSWLVNRDAAIELLDAWKSTSIDRATLHSVRRQIKKSDDGFVVRVVDMGSKRTSSGLRVAEGVRSLRGDAYADDPWMHSDFARINNLHSGSIGQADRDCYDEAANMTFQVHSVQPRGTAQSGRIVEVGALAIHYTDPILKWIQGERD
jgi:hypothetical protein